MNVESREVINLPTEQAITVWDVINIIASVLGIVSAFVTIIAACRTKRYAKSIVQAYSAESLVVANEKIEQAKEIFLKLRSIEFGKARGASPKRTQEDLSNIESLLDEAEKKTPNEKALLKSSISQCKTAINNCVENPNNQNNYFLLRTYLDRARKNYQAEIDNARKETIYNLR